MTRHELAPDQAEIMLAELHTADPPRRRKPTIYLVVPCPLCGVPIEAAANKGAHADVVLSATGEGWESYRATITARGTAVHIHSET